MINLFGSLVTQQLEMTGTSCIRHAKYAIVPVRKSQLKVNIGALYKISKIY